MRTIRFSQVQLYFCLCLSLSISYTPLDVVRLWYKRVQNRWLSQARLSRAIIRLSNFIIDRRWNMLTFWGMSDINHYGNSTPLRTWINTAAEMWFLQYFKRRKSEKYVLLRFTKFTTKSNNIMHRYFLRKKIFLGRTYFSSDYKIISIIKLYFT